MKDENISSRTSRILHVFGFALLAILLRTWYLSVALHDEHYEKSRRPQRRTVIEKNVRATIRDRFNIPLAMNTIQYNAAICYSAIRQIPTVKWERDAAGKKRRVLARRRYVEKLSQFLGETLKMDPDDIEDTIYGRACLFPHTPFVLKEDISENLYYKLRMSEKNWLGIQMQKSAKRIYPQGKLACDAVGYMGAIAQKEYLQIANEIQMLRGYLSARDAGKAVFLPKGYTNPQDVQLRLNELEEKGYTINDLVGKSGVEAAFDQELRGSFGKKIFEVDVRGNILRELPGSKTPISGERVILSISSELQKEAEKLLAEYELFQDRRDANKVKERRRPWQRGGAIVAMHPKTGEILAMASYPQFDPNDFVLGQSLEKRLEKRSAVLKWLENEIHIGEIWDGKVPLQRERFSSDEDSYFCERLFLTWEGYLDTILPIDSPIRMGLTNIGTIATASNVQTCLEKLLHCSEQDNMRFLIEMLYPEDITIRKTIPEDLKWALAQTLTKNESEVLALKEEIDPYLMPILHNDDKVLMVDLLRMLIKKDSLTSSLLSKVGDQPLPNFHYFCQLLGSLQEDLKRAVRSSFHVGDFKKWREKYFREFLRVKRKKEKETKHYARPYVEYLEIEERKQFQVYWEKNRLQFLYANINDNPAFDELKEFLQPLQRSEKLKYLQALRSFQDLGRPLYGKYPTLRQKDGIHLEKHLAAAFYPYTGFGYGRSSAFRQANPIGSVFKLIPAYTALKQRYLEDKPLNPLTLTDDLKTAPRNRPGSQIMGHLADGSLIKRIYKGGRLPNKYKNIGEVDLVKAIERSSNIYFSILCGDVINQPSSLIEAASDFGFGNYTGIDIPGEYRGNLPNDLQHNKTGLYAFAIGQHSLVGTPLQAAVAFSAIANKGKILKPQIVKLSAGKKPDKKEKRLFSLKNYPYKQDLSPLGIQFPLFTQNLTNENQGFISFRETRVKNTIFFPDEIREMILDGMYQAVNGVRGSARSGVIRKSYQSPAAINSYRRIHPELYGKTGTAEILYKQTIDQATAPHMEKHVSFGGISFEDEERQEPELVVIVFLRYGEAGKQGAPMAARLIDKWRQIKNNLELNIKNP